MKIKTIWLTLIFLIATIPLLGFITVTPAASTPAQASSAKWWDKFGEPEYGGTIKVGEANISAFWDPFVRPGGVYTYYLELPWIHDWALDRKIWAFSTPFAPAEYYVGNLVESWEMPDAKTINIKIRKEIHWQDKPPVNGRVFTAHDMEFHYDRLMGTGSGYDKPCPVYTGRMGSLEKVTAIDDYTAHFKFSSSAVWNFYTVLEQGSYNFIQPRETVAPEAPLLDWKKAVGTGPWIVSSYVDGSSLTFSRNPDYWGTDERYPKNRLPYADELQLILIPDVSTRLAAIRTDKVNFLQNIGRHQAMTLAERNPELKQAKMPYQGTTLDFRLDKAPFTDIRVRKALQMAVDRKTIAKNYYAGTVEPIPAGWVHPSFKGYCFAYEYWPQELKDEYGFNQARARELLAEAAADGVFKPNEHGGFDTHAIVAAEHDMELIEIYKAYLMDIGVDMEIRVMDTPAAQSFTRGLKHDQMVVSGSCGAVIPPDMSLSMSTTGNSSNINIFNDPVYDNLFKQFQTSTSMDEAKRLLVELDRYNIEQHINLRLFPVYQYNIWLPYLKGYSGENMLRASPLPLARIWISQK